MTPRAWLALWAVYILWGSTYLGIELAGETIPPLLSAGIRFTTVGVLLTSWMLVRHGLAPFRIGWPAAGSVVLCGLLLIGANALLFVAERRVPIGLAALIFASVPLWLVVFRSVTGDRPAGASLAGTAFGFIGVAVLLRPGADVTVTGVLMVVCSALMWAFGTFLSSKLPMPRDAVTTAGVQGLAGGLLLIPVGLMFADGESFNPADWSTRSLLGLLYLIVFGSIIGYTAYVWLVTNVPLGTVATYAYVNPIVAITLGVIILHEVLTWQIAAGAAVILTSVAVVIRNEMSRRPDEKPPLIET
ncbi:EamA family transporter [Gaiella sp.]|uniref:EamA family transporter n=1 Tax=Gaiella sp. TaxID=2663207 RepID=UPI0032639F30